MAKKISIPTEKLAYLLEEIALRPYRDGSHECTDEQKWVILSAVIKGLSKITTQDFLVTTSLGACFNFSALAEMDQNMLIKFFKTPGDLYDTLSSIAINGISKYINANKKYLNMIYDIKDIDD